MRPWEGVGTGRWGLMKQMRCTTYGSVHQSLTTECEPHEEGSGPQLFKEHKQEGV